MTTKLFALTFTVFLFFAQPSLLLGQSVSQTQDWAAVEALAPGVKLLVETKDGKQVKGKLKNVSAGALALDRKNRTENFNKDEIKIIYRLSNGSRAKSLLIGTAAGVGVGAGAALIALGATGGSDDGTGIVAAGTLIGGGVGALLGLVAGKGSRRTLIYEAR
jgi:hypothetical protein